MVWLLRVLALVASCALVSASSFALENDQFVLNGKSMQLLSGSIHYARVPPEYWADRLQRLRSLGLNTIETYVPWNWHETTPGDFNFDGAANLTGFLHEAQQTGLLVLLRAGPYICGEWEFGGFPAWLLKAQPQMALRTNDTNYIAAVDAWWSELLPRVKPWLIQNGGPVVMVQVENEYGSYGDVSQHPGDKSYLEWLVAKARSELGSDIVLYTTDGGNEGFMTRGTLKGGAVYSVGDFGPGSDPNVSFAAQKEFNAPGRSPPFCSEFYSGWLTHWGEKMANTSTSQLATALDAILSAGASASMYMGHGGTNFGFWNGANGAGTGFMPSITSYDYDSPVNEYGAHGFGSDGVDKFKSIASVAAKHFGPSPPEPAAVPTKAFGSVAMTESLSLLSEPIVSALCNFAESFDCPPAVEALGQNYGFTLYTKRITVAPDAPSTLAIDNPRDLALVAVGATFKGSSYRCSPSNISLGDIQTPNSLHILLENMGRINYGHAMNDSKGMDSVSLNGDELVGSWGACPLPLDGPQLDTLAKQTWANVTAPTEGPTLYRAILDIQEPADTFVVMDGWHKGSVWINGFNLGRYWLDKGPLNYLYLPAPLLRQGGNEVLVLELLGQSSATPTVNLADADARP